MSKDPLSDPLDTGLVEAAADLPQLKQTAPVEKTGDELRKEAFVQQVIEARKPQPAPPPPEQATTRQLDQTTREMAKGAERVKYSQEQELRRPARPAPSATDGTMTPVFRPHEYQHESKNAVPFKG
jgi:hypothetical protein